MQITEMLYDYVERQSGIAILLKGRRSHKNETEAKRICLNRGKKLIWGVVKSPLGGLVNEKK